MWFVVSPWSVEEELVIDFVSVYMDHNCPVLVTLLLRFTGYVQQ